MRRKIPASVSQEVTERTDGKRACGAPGKELDHIVPLHAGGTDEPSNLRLLCQACHREITGQQRAGGSMISFDPFNSYLPEPLWGVVENGPRAFVHRLAEPGRSGALVQADVIKCRRNVMWHA